jgi:hypothetical protein
MYAQAESAGVLSVPHSVSHDAWLLDVLWVDYYSSGSEILGRVCLKWIRTLMSIALNMWPVL